MFFSVLYNAGIRWAECFVYLFGGLFFVYVWMTFSWFGIGYFEIWPPKSSELDEGQKRDIEDYFKLKPGSLK
jgi:hypothetical protein